jgi:hypothetical protein
MSFIKNFTAGAKIVFTRFQTRFFWIKFAKFAIPFFIIVTIISLLMNSSKEIFAGDFAAVAETNFNNGKWQDFFGFKIFFSTLYALYVTNKNLK